MGSTVGHRIVIIGVGALRCQRHIPSKYLPKYPHPSRRCDRCQLFFQVTRSRDVNSLPNKRTAFREKIKKNKAHNNTWGKKTIQLIEVQLQSGLSGRKASLNIRSWERGMRDFEIYLHNRILPHFPRNPKGDIFQGDATRKGWERMNLPWMIWLFLPLKWDPDKGKSELTRRM